MSPKGIRHENIKRELTFHLVRNMPADHTMITETTLYVNDTTFFEPDFIVWPKRIERINPKNDVPMPQLSLLPDVPHTSK